MVMFFMRLRNKKGVSLVEVIVVLAVASILLLCATGMMTPAQNLMNSVKGNAHLDSLSDSINEYIRGKLHNSIAISIIKNDSSSDFAGEVAKQSNLKSTDYILETKSIAILKNNDGQFRLYDFDKVNASNISGYISAPSEANHAVFNNEYYENRSIAVAFSNSAVSTKTEKDELGNNVDYNTISWLKVYSQCFTDDGNIANQIKSVSFKLMSNETRLNLNNTNDIIDESGEVKTLKYDDFENGIVIVYTTKNLNKRVSA